jgi:hypothetical protein
VRDSPYDEHPDRDEHVVEGRYGDPRRRWGGLKGVPAPRALWEGRRTDREEVVTMTVSEKLLGAKSYWLMRRVMPKELLAGIGSTFTSSLPRARTN